MPARQGPHKKAISVRLSQIAIEDAAVLQHVWGVTRTAAIERALAIARVQVASRRMPPGPGEVSAARELRREMSRNRRTGSGPLLE